MTHVMSDLRYACRGLGKAPVFTTIAVLSIALGIGANTAIFALVDQVLLRVMPVKAPHEYWSCCRGVAPTAVAGARRSVRPFVPDVSRLRRAQHGVARSAASVWTCTSAPGGRTERIRGDLVSGTFFPVLGVRAACLAERSPGADDDRTPGAHPVAVLSYSLLEGPVSVSYLDLVGQKIVVNDQPMTVVGVAQEGFEGVDLGSVTRVFIPIAMKASPDDAAGGTLSDNRRSRWVHIFGRLKPGVTAEQAPRGPAACSSPTDAAERGEGSRSS